MMKASTFLLLALATLSPLAAHAQETRQATRTLRIRAEPRPSAPIVTTAPAGAEIQVNGCDHGGGTWCAVTYRRRDGYAPARAFETATASPAGIGSAPPTARSPRRPATTGTRSASSAGREYIRGPRGGCYYMNGSQKVYVARANCGGASTRPLPSGGDDASRRSPGSSRSSGGREYIRGPRGGCYYLSGSGRKVYVAHSFCGG